MMQQSLKDLIMGTSTEGGFIRSHGKTSLGSGKGFYLDGKTGNFTFGNSGGNRIEWDGNILNVVTKDIDIELEELDVSNVNYATVKLRVTNNRNISSTITSYRSSNYLGISSRYEGLIAANSSKIITFTNQYHGHMYTYYVNFTDFGRTDNLIVNIPPKIQNFEEEVFGAGMSTPWLKWRTTLESSPTATYPGRLKYSSNGQIYMNEREMGIRHWYGYDLDDVAVTATISRGNATGAGVDAIYAFPSNTTGSVLFTHDYTGTGSGKMPINSAFIIQGYINSP